MRIFFKVEQIGTMFGSTREKSILKTNITKAIKINSIKSKKN